MKTVSERIEGSRTSLSPAERRVAETVLADAELVAFGTVAGVAAQAAASGATVVRLAGRLGYDGFVALQAAVQAELTIRLRPASERMRRPLPSDAVGRTLATELDNVHATLDAVDRAKFAAAVRLLARRSVSVGVVAGESSLGVAVILANGLGTLRPGVALLGGGEVAVVGALALFEPGDVLIALDLRRYDRSVLAAVDQARAGGLALVTLTDSPLSPLAAGAAATFTVAAEGAGPFDSQVGMLAMTNALVSGAASRLRTGATRRIDRLESAWRETGALTDP